MALLTTTPANDMIPIMVMIITKSIWNTTKPIKTPIKLKNTLNPMINGVVIELNCATMMRIMRNKANSNALDKNAISFACSSC